MSDLPGRAAVVVVGGGVIGLSTAYHLAASGVRDVVLVERDELGSGSTSKAAGGVRAQFSDAVNVELGLRSLRTLETFRDDFGQEIDLHQVGYLFLLDDPGDVARFERDVALQNGLGVPSRMVDVAEAKTLSPLVETDGLLAAAYSPTDGHCTPESVVLGYATAARRHGATVLRHTEVVGIEHDGDTITGVLTSAGRIETGAVVCAAGPWSRAVGAMVDVDLPVTPERRDILVTEPIPGLDPRTPFTIDFTTSFYFHAEGAGLLMGMSDPDLIPAAVERRTPSLRGVGVASGWSGLYENTPDHNALIGEAVGMERFLYATGFSGHGFLMGPAVGEVVRDLYLGRRPVVDVSALDVGRFEGRGARPELNIV
ncbi:MAG TPA: FAD-binding oxidoreductase [Nocardioides sp.]|uniref:NAD(P)/FAD-dependent oxidoreductase n=1 Tax=Nocardioides sp. TaxID=35761 RepID=UPI002E36C9D8|nr:FAD-binding oxidoreductase [Nocardioides sp.]HEX5087890.1 FAD-binding oxidoreductase [Nocardioides sp.]